jgi:hypothetical protein
VRADDAQPVTADLVCPSRPDQESHVTSGLRKLRTEVAADCFGHRTESIYRRYVIADEGMLKESAVKLAALHLAE